MSYRTITINQIEVIGTIWMPASTCAMTYKLTAYDIENIGNLPVRMCRSGLIRILGTFRAYRTSMPTSGILTARGNTRNPNARSMIACSRPRSSSSSAEAW